MPFGKIVAFKIKERTANSSFFFWLVFLSLLIVGDQLTKYCSFRDGCAGWLERLRPVFGKQNFKNYDFVFSLRFNAPFMYVVYGVLIFWMVRHLMGQRGRLAWLEQGAWLLMLTGAGLNLFERIILGYVRDFVYFFGAIFNLADFYILAGAATLLILELNQQLRQRARHMER